MGHRYLNVRINGANDASMSCKNFVNFGPVTPELTELICERLVRHFKFRTLAFQIVQQGLAMASIARDDPSMGGGHVCWDRMMASSSLAGLRSRCVPGMHRDPMHFRHRQTDTDIVA